jgi:hypothetical protein
MMKPNRRGLFQQASLTLLGGAFGRLAPEAVAQKTASKGDDRNCSRAADGTPLDVVASEIRR